MTPLPSVVLGPNGHVALHHRPPPALHSNEARIRVLYAGICSTDLHLIRGYKGFRGVLGHEFVGVVDACPSAPEWVGVRVVGDINIACTECAWCAAHPTDGRHCEHRRVLGILNHDGCLAPLISLPISNLCRVPPSVPDHDAVFAEPLAAALRALESTAPFRSPTSRVAILGDGKLGLLIAAACTTSHIHATHYGRHTSKLALSASMGHTTRRSVEDVLKYSAQFDVVFEATGTPEGLRDAMRLARPRGVIALKSTYADRAELDLSRIVVSEYTVVGSRCGSITDAVDLMEAHNLPLRALIAGVYPAESALEALEVAGERGVLKVLVSYGGGVL